MLALCSQLIGCPQSLFRRGSEQGFAPPELHQPEAPLGPKASVGSCPGAVSSHLPALGVSVASHGSAICPVVPAPPRSLPQAQPNGSHDPGACSLLRAAHSSWASLPLPFPFSQSVDVKEFWEHLPLACAGWGRRCRGPPCPAGHGAQRLSLAAPPSPALGGQGLGCAFLTVLSGSMALATSCPDLFQNIL